MPDSELRFNVLGPVEVHVGGAVVNVGPARGQGVLAALLLQANRPVTADQLLDRVWGDGRLPDRPRHTVQTYVSLLRRALRTIKDVSIVRRSNGYLLSVDEQLIDVHKFRALVREARAETDDRRAISLFERALAQWRGDALGAQDTPYLNGVRARLSQERHAAQRDLTDLHLRNGLHGAILAELSFWAREHPLDERLAGQLMLALLRCGRQADALQHYQRLRARLAEELGADPSPALQSFHQQILLGDPTLSAPVSAPAAMHPRAYPVTAPRQLPAAPRLFAGRARELLLIDEALAAGESTEGGFGRANGRGGSEGSGKAGGTDGSDGAGGPSGAPAVVAISGAAGIGKTALALHWSHRNLDRFPDAQLYVDLCAHDRSRQPVTAAEALRWFLRALGLSSAMIPADEQERSALYRSLLAGRRVLIVLDNALDYEQVRPLLPGTGPCLTLITSREQLTDLIAVEGAHPVALDVLGPREARELVTRRLGERRCAGQAPAVDELVALCGGRPLELSAAAALAAVQAERPLAEVVAEAAAELRARSDLRPGSAAASPAAAPGLADLAATGAGLADLSAAGP